jgi:rfaE bifunctional protein nucleotidyltransferase chain/domain
MVTHPGSKILAREDLLARFGRPRAGRVVFTNGCFDLLHRGHVEYLFAARELGDHLVVAVNGDASVRRLKGDARPVVTLADRAYVLAGLGCVDAVTAFDEDTPRELIAALLPDVLVKGGDYRPEDVVGGEEVRAAGGEVIILPFVQGRSTTTILERLEAHG